jgi:hypothetical protein
MKKARRAKLLPEAETKRPSKSQAAVARELFELAAYAQRRGWNPEALLRGEALKRERTLRRRERNTLPRSAAAAVQTARQSGRRR